MRSDVGAPPINPDQVYDAGDLDRLNAILRFLFAAVRIGESHGQTVSARLRPRQHRAQRATCLTAPAGAA